VPRRHPPVIYPVVYLGRLDLRSARNQNSLVYLGRLDLRSARNQNSLICLGRLDLRSAQNQTVRVRIRSADPHPVAFQEGGLSGGGEGGEESGPVRRADTGHVVVAVTGVDRQTGVEAERAHRVDIPTGRVDPVGVLGPYRGHWRGRLPHVVVR